MSPKCDGNRESAQSDGWFLHPELSSENAIAERFIDKHGLDLRYVADWKKWIVWSGTRFEIDSDSTIVLRKARQFVQGLWQDPMTLAKAALADPKDIEQGFKVCKFMNKERQIGAIIKLARADKRVTVSIDDLNQCPTLLNLENGTLDLRSATFREHRRDDLLTQLAGTEYVPDAVCPCWLETLAMIFDGDQSLIRYVQQLLGYSLSANGGESLLPIAIGNGANGKSTVWNTIIELLGDYGLLAPDSLVLGAGNTHPTEKAALYQKRIVAISEPEQGQRLRESRVKELTGDSVITARRMREDFWTFNRTHTFWMSTNHLPSVAGTDDGIWRRIKLIPFDVDLRSVVKPVPNFYSWLIEHEGPGILNWLVEGYRSYCDIGLVEPQRVTSRVNQYRVDEDNIGNFVAERCVTGDHFVVTAQALFSAYRDWGGKLSSMKFGKAIGERYDRDRPTDGEYRKRTIYRGIGLVVD